MADLREFDKPNFKNSTFRLDKPSNYLLNKARKDEFNGYSNLKKSMTSATIYIGKLSYNTTEEQLFELFSKVGEIDQIKMGLDKLKLTPTGFCFIIFRQPNAALDATKFLNKMKINGQQMEIDLDPGFEEGRQFGRGLDGAQRVHNNQRSNYRRGGYRGRGNFRGGRGRGGRGRGRGGYRERNQSFRAQFDQQQQQEQQLYNDQQPPVSTGASQFYIPPMQQQNTEFMPPNSSFIPPHQSFNQDFQYRSHEPPQFNQPLQSYDEYNPSDPYGRSQPPHINNDNADLPPHMQ